MSVRVGSGRNETSAWMNVVVGRMWEEKLEREEKAMKAMETFVETT